MFFTKRSPPALYARLSPHDHTPSNNNSHLCKDSLPSFMSWVDLSTDKLALGSACHSMPVSHTLPSQNVASLIYVDGNAPRTVKPFWIQCESGTLIRPPKTHVWSQRRHLTSQRPNTALNLNKDGRHRGISLQVPTGIVFQKHVLASGLRWRTQAFPTNVRRYSPKTGTGSVIKNEYVSKFSPLEQGTRIRDHLRNWQRQHEILVAAQHEALKTLTTGIVGVARNPISQFGVDDSLRSIDQDGLPLEESLHLDAESEGSLFEGLYQGYYLRKGDVVELRLNGEPILAVFIRQLENQSQFYTITGNWVHRLNHRVTFVIPGMIPTTQLEPILPYLPAEQVDQTSLDHLNTMDSSAPRGAGAMIIAELNYFHRLATEIIMKNSSRLNQAFDIIAHPTERLALALEEITMKVLQISDPSELSYPALWAVHKTITRTEQFILSFWQTRNFPQIHVVSKQYAEDLARLKSWVREYQEQIINNTTGIESGPLEHDMTNPLPAFLEKARALIAHSRKSRVVTKHGRIGIITSNITPPPPKVSKFNRHEQMIARVISQISCGYADLRDSDVPFFIPVILRATGMYEAFQLGLSTAFVFSQETGQLPPWTNKETHDPMLPLQGYRDALHKFGRPACKDSKPVESFRNMTDSMAPFRKDWADIPVFCIDDKYTKQIDDGVSIEEIQGNASACWVHVHVANPSAFINPTSSIARLAEELIASRYLVNESQPMISNALAQARFSLANGRPCITFSAKVTAAGDIAETKISHGIIRNVKFITPTTLDRELNSKRKPASSFTFVVGKREANLISPCNSIAQNPATEDPAESQRIHHSDLKLLRKLSEVSAARFQRRIQAGAIGHSRLTRHDVSVEPATTSAQNKVNRHFDPNDPIISVTTTTFDHASVDEYMADAMVGSLMLLAGEVAASWCAERNIATTYIGTMRNPDPPESPELYRQKLLDAAMLQKGSLRSSVILYYTKLLGTTTLSPIPIKHLPLGLPAYCRTTSPLRRYGDLLTHWQIEAAIRQERATGRSLIGNSDGRYLPFSLSQIEALGPRIKFYEKLIRTRGERAENHWIIQLLFRAFYFNEATLPSTFTVHISHRRDSNQTTYYGRPIEIDIASEVPENEATRQQGGCFESDIWEARITEIDCYQQRVIMEAIRLVSREETSLTLRA